MTAYDTDTQLIPWEAGSCSAGQEIPSFYRKRTSITVVKMISFFTCAVLCNVLCVV